MTTLWGYCLDAQQLLADRTAELLWLREKGPSSPWHRWRRHQHCHRGRALVTNEAAQPQLCTPLHRWPCCPISQHNYIYKSIWFAEIVLSLSSCRYRQRLRALGYWKIRVVSPICASSLPLLREWLSLLGAITESLWSPWMGFTAKQRWECTCTITLGQ